MSKVWILRMLQPSQAQGGRIGIRTHLQSILLRNPHSTGLRCSVSTSAGWWKILPLLPGGVLWNVRSWPLCSAQHNGRLRPFGGGRGIREAVSGSSCTIFGSVTSLAAWPLRANGGVQAGPVTGDGSELGLSWCAASASTRRGCPAHSISSICPS